MKIGEKKCLIAFFSRKGNNYVNGRIVNLPIGNTEVIAKMLREIIAGDIFCIETIKPYPEDYEETTTVAKQELHSNARPELSDHVGEMDAYQTIFIGYPNWWGTIPMAVATFLSQYDLSGKTILPFCTNEGSGLGRSVTDITKLCPKSTVLDGLAIRGGDVKNARNKVSEWLRELEMIE